MILRAALALAALLLAGCASVGGAKTEDGSAAEGAPTVSTSLEVDGPKDLAALLERYLDLARVGRMARGDAIDDAEWSRLIEVAPTQVRDLLQTEGYFEPKVKITRVGAGGERRVRLALDPGPRTRVSRLTLEFEGELQQAAERGDERARATLADLRRAWPLAPGKAFRNADWIDAKAAVVGRLRAAGYATAQWTGTGAEVDAAKHEVRLFLVADSGPLFRFGELNIEGLASQDRETVGHLANLAPGTPVTETLLLDYQERLQKSGLFDNATVTLDPDPDRAANAVIDVHLHEAPLQVWTFGVGVSANTGPRASVEHVYRRVFGQPLTAHNKVVWGGLEQSWTGELSTHPGENLYRTLLGATVDRLESDSDIVLSQQVRLGRTQDTQKIERLYFVQAERSARTTKSDPPLQTSTIAYSLNYHGVYRQLDSVVLPTDGFSFSGQSGVGFSRSTDGERGPYARLYARLTGYKPIGDNWYGQARIELGQVIKREALTVPESQLFRAGGDESVRGYGYRSLGPLVDGVVSGGTHLMTGSIEVARPLAATLPSLWGAVFVDAGRAANDWTEIGHPALGVGVGLRWRSPVGPLRLDWAYGRDVHKARLHFSVGIAF